RNGAAPKHRALRQAARERFASLPWPTARSEDWRFTNIAPLLELPFEIPRRLRADANSPPPGKTLRLVFVNGQYEKALSPPMPPGVRIGSLRDASPASLGQIVDPDSVFTALNTSFLDDGAVVEIPDGKVVERPIEIVHLAS